jgi:hypothetical protein
MEMQSFLVRHGMNFTSNDEDEDEDEDEDVKTNPAFPCPRYSIRK